VAARYVWRDLVRNPRRTLAAMVGVILGVGLFSGVLFFVDGSSATMTKRALEPLALDMQRVITSPLGGGLRLREELSPAGPLKPGERARITLTVVNAAPVPANEVVVNDEPPPPLSYVHGTTRRDGHALRDRVGQSPLAQGAARSGLNIGTVPPRSRTVLSYVARAERPVEAAGKLRPGARISSREEVVPARANTPPPPTLDQLRERIARVPGVAAADSLSFVDLPPRSLSAAGASVDAPVRVFAFDPSYVRHHPSVRVAEGSLAPGAALLSGEAARALRTKRGSRVRLTLPGRRRPLVVPVSGIADLSRAKPLFYSRKASKLEEFLYVPDSVVVTPETFRNAVLPAYRRAAATRGTILKSLPVLEVDVSVDRRRLEADPAAALRQTKEVAAAIARIAPGQNYLIDNISNTLAVARDDAEVGRRTFVFLGLPGLVLAALLAGYAGSVLAAAQRREQANLRLRGADSALLTRMLALRTLVIAGIGALAGTCLGLLSAMAVLGTGELFDASAGDLTRSALLSVGAGLVATGLALYVPGRRALRREVATERRELTPAHMPAWRRLRLDLVFLVAAGIAGAIAIAAGGFDAPSGSVSTGESVSLPSRLLVAPLLGWIGGVLLAVRLLLALAPRLPLPGHSRFGPAVRGILGRSLRRRPWALATGTIAVGLIMAFGVSTAMFAASYDDAKAADAEWILGGDLRVTPSPLLPRPPARGFTAQLERTEGVSAATPVVAKAENSVLIGPDDQDHEDLAAIDPADFRRIAPLTDEFFVDTSADAAMSALERDPRTVLVGSEAADALGIEKGERVSVLLARGTKRQALRSFRVVGLFDRFPGFPQGVDLVANRSRYQQATGIRQGDFYLASADDHSHGGLARTVAAIRTGPTSRYRVSVETREGALDKDQSSLTALNVHGLIDLDSLYTLLMSVAAVGIFVFGLLLHRRREYVTLRAQGMRGRDVRALVAGEAALVTIGGLAAGTLVGLGMAALLVHVLRPLFVLAPELAFPLGDIALLAALALAATVVSSLIAALMLRRMRASELLRET
jgi:putative ABC transport system permease protein